MRLPRLAPGLVPPLSVLRRLRHRLLIPAALMFAVGDYTPAASAADKGVMPVSRTISAGQRRDEVVSVYDKVKASVVNIHSERTVASSDLDPFRPTVTQTQRVNGMGTGIILDARGYILTNFHVVDDVNTLRIRLHDGTGYPARVVAVDRDADLALLKVEPSSPLPVMGFGTATDLMVGEPVIAIGNAYGYEHTVTDGRVSFKGRDVTLNKDMGYKNLIQTSAPINPGNSGGPLMNVLGELVGVNVAIRAGAQNIGFALPIDFVITRAAEMMSVKKRSGLRHGMRLKDEANRSGDQTTSDRKVTVESVEPESPAEAAGVKPGDVIERVGDIDVATSIDVERGFLDRSAGSKTPIVLVRNDETKNVTLELQTHSTPKPTVIVQGDAVWSKVGMRLQSVGPIAVIQANPQLHGGMLVMDVQPGSPAAAAGLMKGDVLVGLHTWETINQDNVLFVINHKDLASFSPLKFYIARDGKLRDGFLNVSP